MYIYFEQIEKPQQVACFASLQYNLNWKTPEKIKWGLDLLLTKKEVEEAFALIPLVNSRIDSIETHPTKADATRLVVIGTYPSFANLLIEGSLIRLLADKPLESHDGYPYQIRLRELLFKERKVYLHEYHDDEEWTSIRSGGHSPFTDISLNSVPKDITLAAYVEASARITGNSYGINCKKTYEKLIQDYKNRDAASKPVRKTVSRKAAERKST